MTEKQNFGEKLVTIKPGHAYYSKVDPGSRCRFQIHLCILHTLLVLKFASYSFSLSFKFARFNFATLLRLIRASNFPCSFFLVCLIELLPINVFIMSVFLINKYYNICQNLIKKRLGSPQKMPSKLCKLISNASKIQLKTYFKCVYALINQLICITNNECLILHPKAFRADYNSRSTKINAPSAARILIQVR